MGTKNLVMLKTHIDSIKLCFANDFVYENVLWPLVSLWVFFSNYLATSMGFILTYIFRFQRKKPPPLEIFPEQIKGNQFEDYETIRFTEELANFLFPSSEDFHITSEEIDCYFSEEKGDDIDMHEDGKNREGKTKGSIFFKESVSYVIENFEKIDENETEYSVFFNCNSDFYQDGSKRIENVQEEKTEENVVEDDKKREVKTDGSVILMESVSNVDEDFKKIDENETECSVFSKCDSNFHQDGSKIIDEVQEEKKIVGFDFEEEPMKFSFSFLHYFRSENVSDNAIFTTRNIAKEELLEHNLVEDIVSQVEEEEPIQGHCEELECETLKPIEDVEKTQFSIDINVSQKGECKNEGGEESMEKTKETLCENEMDEMEYDEDEDEWEHDELVEQIKLELRNARQGGLATILEDEEERESLKVVRELKPLIIEEMEYKDHIVEIQKFYRCYAEKIRKLDVLNYQAMQAIGLLQLKDPLKLMQMPKSTLQHAKPLVSQNLWPRKAPKQKYDPMLKLVHEVHRDLELVYVGQVCLSWEILCWQHRKIQDLKKYDSQQRPHRYNLVDGEFQLFRVLMQRFIEDEPFQQESRIQNYVQNRFVIRNLLQVPSIKDDNTKDKKKVKWSEEDAVSSERLAHIIKECMQVFWEFVRADKDDVNTSSRISHQNRNDVNEMEISDLLSDIQTQLQKKERKLKDKVRSGNCIVRKFQKHHEGKIQLDHDQLLAQVGLRLISRVMNMNKLSKDQLVWCNEKLNQIKFVGREMKIQVEPSFLLFPC